MERTVLRRRTGVKPNVEASVIKKSWRKLGGGSFWLGNRMIKPGERFSASESEIPEAFRDVIVPSDSHAYDIPIFEGKRALFKLMPSKDEDGMFDIIDIKGKKFNGKPLAEKEAREFKDNLES